MLNRATLKAGRKQENYRAGTRSIEDHSMMTARWRPGGEAEQGGGADGVGR